MDNTRRSTVSQSVDFWQTVSQEDLEDADGASHSRKQGGAIGDASKILKQIKKEHARKEEEYNKQMEQWDLSKLEMEREEVSLNEKQQILDMNKVKQKKHKEALLEMEVELKAEVQMLAEKEQEIEEFKEAHKLMVQNLEDSMKGVSQDWSTPS